MKIVIKTEFISTNRLYTTTNHGRKVKTVAAREIKQMIYQEASDQIKRDPFTDPLKVEIKFFFGDARRRDIDNIKGFIDALTGVLWEDDSLIHELHLFKAIDRENPRSEVTVKKL